jgi:hypothetical protein
MVNHGGKRKGAGRPPGSGKGRTVETRSISMPPEAWAKLDQLRAEQSRGAFLAAKLKRMRE